METENYRTTVTKNTALFNAYDAILKATKINNVTFKDFLKTMQTLHEINVEKNPQNVEKNTHN